jgi:hypothetical protein
MRKVGEISKGMQQGLSVLYKDEALKAGIRYVNNNPSVKRVDLKNSFKLISKFENIDAIRYVAWNMNPGLYNKHLEPYYEQKAQEEATKIIAFERKVAESDKKPTRLKEYLKINSILKWDSKTMKNMAFMMHPDIIKNEKRRKGRSFTTREISTRSDRESLPDFYYNSLGPNYELGSYL